MSETEIIRATRRVISTYGRKDGGVRRMRPRDILPHLERRGLSITRDDLRSVLAKAATSEAGSHDLVWSIEKEVALLRGRAEAILAGVGEDGAFRSHGGLLASVSKKPASKALAETLARSFLEHLPAGTSTLHDLGQALVSYAEASLPSLPPQSWSPSVRGFSGFALGSIPDFAKEVEETVKRVDLKALCPLFTVDLGREVVAGGQGAVFFGTYRGSTKAVLRLDLGAYLEQHKEDFTFPTSSSVFTRGWEARATEGFQRDADVASLMGDLGAGPALLEAGRTYTVAALLEGGELCAAITPDTRETDLVNARALLAQWALFTAGYIHNDEKCDNALMDKEGYPYLIDFGLVIPTAGLSGPEAVMMLLRGHLNFFLSSFTLYLRGLPDPAFALRGTPLGDVADLYIHYGLKNGLEYSKIPSPLKEVLRLDSIRGVLSHFRLEEEDWNYVKTLGQEERRDILADVARDLHAPHQGGPSLASKALQKVARYWDVWGIRDEGLETQLADLGIVLREGRIPVDFLPLDPEGHVISLA